MLRITNLTSQISLVDVIETEFFFYHIDIEDQPNGFILCTLSSSNLKNIFLLLTSL